MELIPLYKFISSNLITPYNISKNIYFILVVTLLDFQSIILALIFIIPKNIINLIFHYLNHWKSLKQNVFLEYSVFFLCSKEANDKNNIVKSKSNIYLGRIAHSD